jgi:hypothetical protein
MKEQSNAGLDQVLDAIIIEMVMFTMAIGAKISRKDMDNFILQINNSSIRETSKIICSMGLESFNIRISLNFREIFNSV